MRFYRLIKANWGRALLANGQPNPDFEQSIEGPDTIDGYDLDPSFIEERNRQGYNVYFFPNHPSRDVYSEGVKYLSGKHIDVFNFVFVDMDLKDGIYESKQAFLDELSQFEVKPSMTVDSGHGIHAYWQIENLQRDQYVLTQLALINRFKTDESVYTVLQLLRMPGYQNVKVRTEPLDAHVITDYSSGEAYQLSDFPYSIYDLSLEIQKRAQTHLNKLDGKLKIDLPDFVNMDELPDKFVEFIEDPKNVAAYKLFYNPKENGDRSAADMKLANILYKNNFNKKEAFSVISNTQKALEKAGSRHAYTETTIDKVYTDRLSSKYKTVGQMIRTEDLEKNLGPFVRGPRFFDTDVLGAPWRKREVLGIIGGSGVGKTTIVLKTMKDAIENNPDNDDIYIFFSLEMSSAEITERWIRLVGSSSPLADRLYVIDDEDSDGNRRTLGLQEIVEISDEIKKLSGKNLGIVTVDHIGILAKHIDVRKEHQFGILSEVGAGRENIRTLSLNSIATQMKPLAKLLDTFLIVLTQTSKVKGQGDNPIEIDGALGISQYEHIMDRIITVWQPLMRVQDLTDWRFLAWQYVKIRNKTSTDRIQTYQQKLLLFDMRTGDLDHPTPEQFVEFQSLEPLAQEARKKQLDKKGGLTYSIEYGKIDSKVRETLKIVSKGS